MGFDTDELIADCTCGQLDPLPFTHADGCLVWERAEAEQRILDLSEME